MTENDLIDALGGSGAVGRLLGVSGPAVSNWKARGEIPARHHYRLYLICQERGIDWQPPKSGLLERRQRRLEAAP